jgi:uncharacterized protein YceK
MKYFMVFVMVLVLLTGCATLKVWVNEDDLAQLEVEATVAELLKAKPTWQPEAIRVTKMVVEAIDNKTLIDIKSVEPYIRSHINWGGMTTESQTLLSLFVTKWSGKITKRLSASGIISPENQMVELRKVFEWAYNAASRPIR